MLLGKIDSFKKHIGMRYPYLEVDTWDDGRFLEDHKRAYVAVVPLNVTEYGTARITTRTDIFDLYTRFWVVWKLPKVNDDIVTAAVQETERLGIVRSVTWNTTEIYRRFGYSYPPKGLSFVAVEVELESSIVKTRNVCECLIQCGEEVAKLKFDLRWFASDEEALAAGYENGKDYYLKAENIYGHPKGTIRKYLVPGEICIPPDSLPWFASDAEAIATGYTGYYYLKSTNLYGMTKGVIKKVSENGFITPGGLPYASSDQTAPVPMNGHYLCSADNIYGVPHGTVKKKVE